MKTIKFLVITFSSIFLIAFIFYLLFVYFNQQNMVFRATTLFKNHRFSFANSHQEIFTTAIDGKKLHGLYFSSTNSKGLVFYLHGNKGTVDLWGRNADFYTNLGYDVFYADYRGFGKSEGQIENEQQVLDDAIVVFDDIQKRFKPSKTIILGYSIGTGIATYLAKQRKCHSLILLAPFYNFTEITSNRVPLFPNFLKKFSFETNLFIQEVSCPITIFHGNKDYVIPIENGIKLKKLLKPTDQFFILENQAHVGINENSTFQKIMSARIL